MFCFVMVRGGLLIYQRGLVLQEHVADSYDRDCLHMSVWNFHV
jgi:hypothetical protein